MIKQRKQIFVSGNRIMENEGREIELGKNIYRGKRISCNRICETWRITYLAFCLLFQLI